MEKQSTDTACDIFLVVMDDTPEFKAALYYAACLAQARSRGKGPYRRGRVGLLRVVGAPDFQHWGNVAARVEAEERAEAERALVDIAGQAQEICPNAQPFVFYIVNADACDAVAQTLASDPHITLLVLAGGTQSADTGPLVAHFTGRGLAQVRVPVVIIPGHLTIDDIKSLLKDV